VNNIVFINDSKELIEYLRTINDAIILCDENTFNFCHPRLPFTIGVPVIKIPSGENNKSMANLQFIWNKMVDFKANRHSTLINLGGGVISDIGGFAAATYNRGIKFINIPTSLMGMVDAANGGKTGVNFKGYKNYIGSFSNPESILIWPEFLKTLPFKHILSGLTEMIKHGAIANKSYFDTLTGIDLNEVTRNTIDWMPVIKQSVAIKSSIVKDDFKESGKRKLLNFGHTIGHAFESYFIDEHATHGHYVSAGMICEAWLSYKKGKLTLESLETLTTFIDSIFNRIEFTSEQLDDIAALTLKDKKNNSEAILCVYLKQIGSASYDNTITMDDVKDSLKFYSHLW